MRSKFNSVFALATVAAIAFGGLSAASAATVEVSSVGGTWTALVPPQGPTNVKGIGTNVVSWGTPFGGGRRQSSYSFVGAASGPLTTGVDFNLGTFTHNNFVIAKRTSITGAGLSVAINLMIGGASRVVNTAFNFAHWETTNNGESNGRCANGGANGSGVNRAGCADRVTLLNNPSSNQSFVIDGFRYILEITGFTRGGQFFTEFWTQERLANSAMLRAKFTLIGPDRVDSGGPIDPAPSPVPLPAAGWLMLAAIGALAAARARRSKA